MCARAQFSTFHHSSYRGEDSQHSSHDHRVLRLEIMCHANGKHLHCEDLTTAPAARHAVHVRVARDEELSELLYEFACRAGATVHEPGAIWKRGDELRPTRGREARRAQLVICRKVAVELQSTSVWVHVFFGRGSVERTSIQLSHSIGRMPIVTLLFVICYFTEQKMCWSVLTGNGLVYTGDKDEVGFDQVLR